LKKHVAWSKVASGFWQGKLKKKKKGRSTFTGAGGHGTLKKKTIAERSSSASASFAPANSNKKRDIGAVKSLGTSLRSHKPDAQGIAVEKTSFVAQKKRATLSPQ